MAQCHVSVTYGHVDAVGGVDRDRPKMIGVTRGRENVQGERTWLKSCDPHVNGLVRRKEQRLYVSHADLVECVDRNSFHRTTEDGDREPAKRFDRIHAVKRFEQLGMNLRLTTDGHRSGG